MKFEQDSREGEWRMLYIYIYIGDICLNIHLFDGFSGGGFQEGLIFFLSNKNFLA